MINKPIKYGEANEHNTKLVIALNRTIQNESKHLINILSKENLTIAQFGVMEVLYHKGPMKICEIIEKTLSTSGNMTVVIRNLEKVNYIEKERDCSDGRVFNIRLSITGEELISKIFPLHLLQLEKTFSTLEKNEKNELLLLLKKLNGL